jgi:hypothetical protein
VNILDLPAYLARVAPCLAQTRAVAAERLATYPPTGPNRKQIARAVANVNAAVDAVERAPDLQAASEAVGRLRVKTMEMRAQLEDHPDALARMLSVMARCAADVLGDQDGEPVAAWLAKLEAGDGVAA